MYLLFKEPKYARQSTKVRFIDTVNQELELICGKRITMSRNGLKMLRNILKPKDTNGNDKQPNDLNEE